MKKCNTFEEQKGTRNIRENVYFGIIVSSVFSSTKPCLKSLLIYFTREIKGFHQTSLGNKIHFRDIMNISPNTFCKCKSTDNSDINIFQPLENPWSFLLAKEKTWKRIFNTNGELSPNRPEKKKKPSKTTINWLFKDIWCYLFIACFDWKIDIFQQTVVRVYFTFNVLRRVIKFENFFNFFDFSRNSVHLHYN